MVEIIRFENLSFAYNDGSLVLADIDLTIQKGEFIAVLGYNGSGKSTFAKLMNGILLPISGRVIVDGMDSSDEQYIYDIRQKVGMVFQNPDNQIVATIVEEDVAFALENLGVAPAEIRERVDASLAAVDMSDHATEAPNLLSGGQKQRVAIAGVIAMRPSVIVLDEPTAMLDPSGRQMVLATITELNRLHNITVILITHYMEEAALADRLLILSEGKIAMDGSPKEVFSDVEAVRSYGLDVPQATEICYLLRQAGVEIEKDILTGEVCTERLLQL
ncbi:MAG: energy-coupling factor transporter ATPase, partial [Oscillospiraceae bacterium]|nr:energy-coupling factor transporter ATPase [Oscillospiraceae bacterium]